jgi:hypothetical protein
MKLCFMRLIRRQGGQRASGRIDGGYVPWRLTTIESQFDTDALLNQYATALMDRQSGIPLGRKRLRLTTYDNCFSGADASAWFMANLEGVLDLSAAQVWSAEWLAYF